MKHKTDKRYREVLKKVKEMGISINPVGELTLYQNLSMYQSDKDNPEYPLWLVVRELGGKTYPARDFVSQPLSQDVFTVVLDDFFIDYTQSLTQILKELKRICNGNILCNPISEKKYISERGVLTVDFEFSINNQLKKISYIDEEGLNWLEHKFLESEIIRQLNGSVTKGQLFYISDESFTFIYLEREKDIRRFEEVFYYVHKIQTQESDSFLKKIWNSLKI